MSVSGRVSGIKTFHDRRSTLLSIYLADFQYFVLNNQFIVRSLCLDTHYSNLSLGTHYPLIDTKNKATLTQACPYNHLNH